MPDLDKIKRNVKKMVDMNAPESDIDGYISSEGITIDDVKNHKMTAESWKIPQASQEDPGLFSRIGDDINKRMDQGAEITRRGASGEQGLGLSMLQGLGKVSLGTANDIVGEVGKSAYGMLPDSVQNKVSQGMGYVANSPVGQAVGSVAKPAMQAYGDYMGKHPVLSDSVDSLANIAGWMTPVKGTSGAGLAAKAGDKAADLAISGAKKGVSASRNALKDSSLIAGLSPTSAEAMEETSKAMRAGSGGQYKEAFGKTLVLKDDAAPTLYNDISKAVGRLSDRRHPHTASVLDDLKDRLGEGGMDLETLEDFRRDLLDVVSDNTDSITGIPKTDAHKALSAIDAIDGYVDNMSAANVHGDISAVENLNAARKQWSEARKFESVANIVKKANGDPNKIKTQFTRFLSNSKNLRGMSKEDISVLRTAANSTTAEKVMKALGRFGISPDNVYLPGVAGGLSTIAGSGGSGAVLVGAGTVARQANKYVARGKAEKALKHFSGKSPFSLGGN